MINLFDKNKPHISRLGFSDELDRKRYVDNKKNRNRNYKKSKNYKNNSEK